jgi:hypothetical protein
MKRYLGGIIICFIVSAASAQITQDAAKQLKIYEDDDFFNIWGKGTDRGYSNGTGIGYPNGVDERHRQTFGGKYHPANPAFP